MAEWFVQLNGHEFDLIDLKEQFSNDELRIVQDEHGFWLRSTDFDGMTDAGLVLDQAKVLIQSINGVGRVFLGAFQPLTVGAIVRINDDGLRQHFFIASGSVHARARVSAIDMSIVDGVEVVSSQSPPPSDAAFTYLLARQDANVAKVLRLLGQNQDWATLYKAYEVVLGDVGGEMWRRGWTTKAEAERFSHTANSVQALGDDARHGIERTQPPANPMTLPDAQVFIQMLVRAWVGSKR